MFEDILVNGQPLDLEKTYIAAIPEYLSTGNEGYEAVLGATIIVDEENAPVLKNIFYDFFGKQITLILYSTCCK